MDYDTFINTHKDTLYYTVEPGKSTDKKLLITFLVHMPAGIYTALGHQGKFEGSVLRIRGIPDFNSAQSKETLAAVNALLLKLHKKPSIRAMKVPSLVVTLGNACKTNDAELVDEILALPRAKEFSYTAFWGCAEQCIEAGNYDLYTKMFGCMLDAIEIAPYREAIDTIVSDLISAACAADHPQFIQHLTNLYPEIDMRQKFDRFFYRAVYQKAWRVVGYFFSHNILSIDRDMTARIERKMGRNAEAVIHRLKTLALQEKLENELPAKTGNPDKRTKL